MTQKLKKIIYFINLKNLQSYIYISRCQTEDLKYCNDKFTKINMIKYFKFQTQKYEQFENYYQGLKFERKCLSIVSFSYLLFGSGSDAFQNCTSMARRRDSGSDSPMAFLLRSYHNSHLRGFGVPLCTKQILK